MWLCSSTTPSPSRPWPVACPRRIGCLCWQVACYWRPGAFRSSPSAARTSSIRMRRRKPWAGPRVSGEVVDADASISALLRAYGYLGGFALIYIEETGIPLFIPGDVFLLYVGSRLPHDVPILCAAWLGFVLAVTLGATNLYLLSRRFGRRLVEHRLARFLHITPDRVHGAEPCFRPYAPYALLFGP